MPGVAVRPPPSPTSLYDMGILPHKIHTFFKPRPVGGIGASAVDILLDGLLMEGKGPMQYGVNARHDQPSGFTIDFDQTILRNLHNTNEQLHLMFYRNNPLYRSWWRWWNFRGG